MLSRRHSRWCLFRRCGHTSSISLEPFAPPELPGFIATMVPLTPVGRLFVSTLRLIVDRSTAVSDSERRLQPNRSLCFMYWTFRSFRLHPPFAARNDTSLCFRSGSTTDRDFILAHHVSRDQCGTSVSPFDCRLTATTGRIEFTCVSDRPFAFR